MFTIKREIKAPKPDGNTGKTRNRIFACQGAGCKAVKTIRGDLFRRFAGYDRFNNLRYEFTIAGAPEQITCACGRTVRGADVKGTFSAEHECGAKCLASKGHACECSCGGKNHGAGHIG